MSFLSFFTQASPRQTFGDACFCHAKKIKVIVHGVVWQPRAEPFQAWYMNYFNQELDGDSIALITLHWFDYKIWVKCAYDQWYQEKNPAINNVIDKALPGVDSQEWNAFCRSFVAPPYSSLPIEEQLAPPRYLP